MVCIFLFTLGPKQERISDKVYKQGNYTLKWHLNNQFDLIFVVVYSVQLLYIDDLLEALAKRFVDVFKDRLLEKPVRIGNGFQFDNDYNRIFDRIASAHEKRPKQMRSYDEKKKDVVQEKKIENSGGDGESEDDKEDEVNKQQQEAVGDTNNNVSSAPEDNAAATTPPPPASAVVDPAFELEENRRRLREIARGGKKPATAPKKETVVSPTKAPPKKQSRVWSSGKVTKEDMANLDRSAPAEDNQQQQVLSRSESSDMGDPTGFADDEDIDWDKLIDDDDKSKASSSAASKVFGFFKTIASGKELESEDLQGPLASLRELLITKNVAADIADKLCDSVATQLIGQKSQAGFGGIKKSVYKAMESALSRVLTPKQSIDILREVVETNKAGRPYVMTFVGVNGVGKSTSLAKVCAWLMHHGKKVLIVACDTFRSGAVEQLRVHASRLNTQVFERGYDKDPASVAMEGIRHAKSSGYDVVLVDTAGRMQDNEPLMRALAKLINLNAPDKVLFVGEALVGNDSVDQLVKFNQALIDQATVNNPRKIDGIILTKFDTIDDKVGAAVSMVYTTGQPVVFVGVGQTYHDIRQLNVHSICRSLLM